MWQVRILIFCDDLWLSRMFVVKPKVALETKPLDIKEGATEALVATCTASGAKPQPDIVWRDDQGTDYPADVTTKYDWL